MEIPPQKMTEKQNTRKTHPETIRTNQKKQEKLTNKKKQKHRKTKKMQKNQKTTNFKIYSDLKL